MTQALFYKPSYDRLKDRISSVAPDLEIALYDKGSFYLNDKKVNLEELNPEYFWIHLDLFEDHQEKGYFDVVMQLPSARWLHTVNAGLDFLPYENLLSKNVRVTNNNSTAIGISEYVLGQVFAYFQNIVDFRLKQQEKKWHSRASREINSTHWLIIGFGHIGKTLATSLNVLGAKVSTVRRSPNTEGLVDEVYSLEQLDEILPKADVVVLACNSNAETRQLVDKHFLTQMKDHSVFVNIARGNLVVESDLKAALDKDKPGYAILDVFNEEPLPQDSWIWHHPKVAMSPHCSYISSGMLRRSEDLFIENLKRMVDGEPLLNEVSERNIY
jgi:phosphoglycerate dehydrogenase-like enzyme